MDSHSTPSFRRKVAALQSTSPTSMARASMRSTRLQRGTAMTTPSTTRRDTENSSHQKHSQKTALSDSKETAAEKYTKASLQNPKYREQKTSGRVSAII